MSTISSRILQLLVNETNVAQYEQPDVAPLVRKIELADLDLLARNIPVLREHVVAVHEAAEIEAEEARRTTRKKLEDFLKANNELGITSVEELLKTLSEEPQTVSKSKSKTKALKDNNSKFTVTLMNPETQKHETFPVINKILSKKITQHPAYLALVKKDKSMTDIDNFLRAFSPEYVKKYPINAKYNKATFHINDQGKLNKQSQEYYQEYLKTHQKATVDEFRTSVKESYKKVD